MSTTLVVDRSRVCAFLSPGGRGCTMPVSFSHPFLCTYHARKEAQASAAQNAGRDIAYSLSARYISYNDLSAALAQTISAVAQHRLSSRTASTIANLSRTLLQSVAGAEAEFIATYGENAWTEKIAQNLNSLRPAKLDEPLRDDPQPDPPEAVDESHHEEASEEQTEEASEEQNEEQNEQQYEDEPPAVNQMTNYWATLNRT
jgi:hypothetical protein